MILHAPGTRRLVCFAFGLAAITGSGMTAMSQDQTWKLEHVRRGEGFFDAVNRGGCDHSQLAQVMADNNVHTEQLSSLREDFPVYLFPGCEQKANEEIAARTKQILAFENGRVGLVHEVAERGEQLVKLQTENTRLSAEIIGPLRTEIARLTAALQKQGDDMKAYTASEAHSRNMVKMEYGGGSAVVAILIMFIFGTARGSEWGMRNVLPIAYLLKYLKYRLLFRVTCTLLGCPIPGCGRDDIPLGEAMAHLESHSEFRLHVDPIRFDVPLQGWYSRFRGWMTRHRPGGPSSAAQ